MCGITGYFGQFDDPGLLVKMCNVMQHRGPDDAGYYSSNGIGLAMRRLAIIDLKTGNQPITNETRDIWVVFNGEIYNYQSLKAELQKSGHSFYTSSDTETIVHLYEEHSLNFVNFLQGMFSIALWDDINRRLILVRDRIGEKPLFYSIQGNNLFFGSEIKTILQAIPNRSVDSQSICDYLALGYVAAPRSFYKDIKKLQPGEMLICEDHDIKLKKYWEFPKYRKHISASFIEAKTNLSELLDHTIELCLKSDVEVGAFLSGGIDSSVLVALMRRHNAHVKTFSVGYHDEAVGFNELAYAKQVANYLGTEHYELILGPQSSIDLLPKIIWHYDEPHGEPTSILVYLLCEFTSKKVKVAMGGTGGDEIFFGYPRYAGINLYHYYCQLPKVLRKYFIEKAISLLPESTKGSRFAKRAKRFIMGSDLSPNKAYASWVSLLHSDIREVLISDAIKKSADDHLGNYLLQYYLSDTNPDLLLDNATALDLNGYLPEYQLTYMDRMSMAHSLEVRSPLCDYKLVEYVTALPNLFRLKGTKSKLIFKEIAKNWLPLKIVDRKKVGFDSPVGQWFKSNLREFLIKFLSRDNITKSGLLDPIYVQILVNDHLIGKRDYSLQLWSIIALETWYRMYIEGKISTWDDFRVSDLRGFPNK